MWYICLGMDIKKISEKGAVLRSKGLGVGVNLFPSKGDLKGYRLELDIILYTNGKGGREEKEFEGLKVIGPGEYESKGIEVEGWYLNPKDKGEKSSVYTVVIDGLTVCILGKISEGLSDSLIEKIGGVHVLLIDLKSDIKVSELWEQVKRLGPNMVVPIGFSSDKGEEVKAFLDAADEEGLKSVEKVKVDSLTLPEDRVVVILNGGK